MSLFAQALLAYQNGNKNAELTLSRDDNFSQTFSAGSFFDDENFPELEQRALVLCCGNVLDVGAAAGRHSLALQKRGLNVTALEIEPMLGYILLQRGVRSVVVANILEWCDSKFDTILMMMNGIGLVGCPENLDRFLQNLPTMLNKGGSLLCTSKDMGMMKDPIHVAYREANLRAGRNCGAQSLSFSYCGAKDPFFDWLHLTPQFFAERCSNAKLKFSLLQQLPSGPYLCRIQCEK